MTRHEELASNTHTEPVAGASTADVITILVGKVRTKQTFLFIKHSYFTD